MNQTNLMVMKGSEPLLCMDLLFVFRQCGYHYLELSRFIWIFLTNVSSKTSQKNWKPRTSRGAWWLWRRWHRRPYTKWSAKSACWVSGTWTQKALLTWSLVCFFFVREIVLLLPNKHMWGWTLHAVCQCSFTGQWRCSNALRPSHYISTALSLFVYRGCTLKGF